MGRGAFALPGLAAAFLAAGCGGGSSPSGPPDLSRFQGTWSGTYENTSPNGPPGGELTLRFTETDPRPRGSCTFEFGEYTVRNAPLTASPVGADRLTITSCGSSPCGYTGDVTLAGGNTLVGTFQGGAGCPTPSVGSTQGSIELHRQ